MSWTSPEPARAPLKSTKDMRVLLCLGLALGAVGHSHRKRHHQLAALEAHDDLPAFEDLMLDTQTPSPAKRTPDLPRFGARLGEMAGAWRGGPR